MVAIIFQPFPNIFQKYPSLKQNQLDEAFEMATADYLFKLYPSMNNRPTFDTLIYDDLTLNRIYKRMDYLVGSSGFPIGVTQYSENGVSFTLDANTLSNYLDIGLPRAGIPK